MRSSSGKSLSAFKSAPLKDISPRCGLHPFAETVFHLPVPLLWLKCSEHILFLHDQILLDSVKIIQAKTTICQYISVSRAVRAIIQSQIHRSKQTLQSYLKQQEHYQSLRQKL